MVKKFVKLPFFIENSLEGSTRNLPMNGSPEPPPPPPRNHDTSNSSFNDSKESNEISEAECDRDHGPRGNYGGKSIAQTRILSFNIRDILSEIDVSFAFKRKNIVP